MITTTDVANFGIKELHEAGKLLSTYKTNEDKTKHFENDGVHIMCNKNSGFVFLTNENAQVAMMDGKYLVDFLTCPECGNEGLITESNDWAIDDCCKKYLKEMG